MLFVGSEDLNLITFQCQRTLRIVIFTDSPGFIVFVDLPRVAEAHPKKMQLIVYISNMFCILLKKLNILIHPIAKVKG